MEDKTIYKYELPTHGIRTIRIPRDSEILSCANQSEKVQLWALVDPKKEIEDRYFEVLFTGDDAYETANVKRVFISTVVLFDGSLICHVFERKEK